jgi:hypothetical protein
MHACTPLLPFLPLTQLTAHLLLVHFRNILCVLQPVRFLDVHSALLSLAATAGEQLTTNMQRWAPAAQHLNLTHVLAHHRKTAMQLAASQQQASCHVAPSKPGDYQGTCKGAADCKNCASSSSGGGSDSSGSEGVHSIDEASGSCGSGDDVPTSEKMKKMEELAGVGTSTSSNVEETRDAQSRDGGKDEVRGMGEGQISNMYMSTIVLFHRSLLPKLNQTSCCLCLLDKPVYC